MKSIKTSRIYDKPLGFFKQKRNLKNIIIHSCSCSIEFIKLVTAVVDLIFYVQVNMFSVIFFSEGPFLEEPLLSYD